MWVLILMWAGTVSGAAFQEFETKAACEEARNWVQVQKPGSASWRYQCLRKGERATQAAKQGDTQP